MDYLALLQKNDPNYLKKGRELLDAVSTEFCLEDPRLLFKEKHTQDPRIKELYVSNSFLGEIAIWRLAYGATDYCYNKDHPYIESRSNMKDAIEGAEALYEERLHRFYLKLRNLFR